MRQSNYELLRILAMLMILAAHANFYSIGIPTHAEAISEPTATFMRFLAEAAACVWFNDYLMISGYFGIRTRWHSVARFVFMVVFWRLFVVAVLEATNLCGLTDIWLPSGRAALMLLIPGYQDWFVASFVLLMLIAPMVNAYIGRASARRLWTFVGLYWGFQWTAGWALDVYSQWFAEGYSVFSFLGYYLLGAAMRKSSAGVDTAIRRQFTIYASIVVIMGMLYFLSDRFITDASTADGIITRLGAINSPFYVITAVALFVAFGRMHFANEWVNRVAASSFAVYLLHMHPLLRGMYCETCRTLYSSYSGPAYLLRLAAFIIGVFAAAVVIDRLRICIWRRMTKALDLRLLH